MQILRHFCIGFTYQNWRFPPAFIRKYLATLSWVYWLEKTVFSIFSGKIPMFKNHKKKRKGKVVLHLEAPWVTPVQWPTHTIPLLLFIQRFFVEQITPLTLWMCLCVCASGFGLRRFSCPSLCENSFALSSAAPGWKWVFDLPDSFWQLTLIPGGSMELSALH